MVSDKDIYRSANEVIKKCGKKRDPVEYALFMMKSHLEKGDPEGGEVWKRIAYGVGKLLSDKPDGDVH
jgi:hypothetical protein